MKLKILLITFILIPLFSLKADEKIYRITYPSDNGSLSLEEVQNIVSKAYNNIGLKVEYIPFPYSRSVIEANLGKYDGELARASEISLIYNNLIQIPVIIYRLYFSYVSLKDIDISKLETYRIGYIAGSRFIDAKTEGLNIYKTSNLEALFKMLENDRIDVIIHYKADSIRFIKKNPKYSDVIFNNELFETIDLYHYIYKSNIDIYEKLTEEMMKVSPITKNKQPATKLIKYPMR